MSRLRAPLGFLLFLLVPPFVAAGPASLRPDSVQYSWSTGPYTYDGSGNIVVIGPQRTNEQNGKTDYYVYDAVSRISRATAHTPSFGNQQSFAYDVYGNLRQINTTTTPGGTQPFTFGVDPATNQLTNSAACPAGTTCFLATYDEAGNQRSSSSGISNTWDALGMMTALEGDGMRREWYVYDSNNERVLIVKRAPAPSTAETRAYSLRGPDKKVLRDVVDTVAGGQHQWSWQKDYVLAGSRLVAAVTPGDIAGEVRRHFHVDHLGSPLLITDDRGFRQASHKYLPFGGDAPGTDTDGERMKFTGHERDFAAGGGQDLDYMHARYYSPVTGRFLSVDPAMASATADMPQTWNRYSYAGNRPITALDPNGLWTVSFGISVGGFFDGAKGEYKFAIAVDDNLNIGLVRSDVLGQGIGVPGAAVDLAGEFTFADTVYDMAGDPGTYVTAEGGAGPHAALSVVYDRRTGDLSEIEVSFGKGLGGELTVGQETDHVLGVFNTRQKAAELSGAIRNFLWLDNVQPTQERNANEKDRDEETEGISYLFDHWFR